MVKLATKKRRKSGLGSKESKRYRPRGSAKTSALSLDQFNFVLDGFRDRGDLRMEIICLLMAKCLRIGDVLRTLRISDVYTKSGEIRNEVNLKEEKTGKPKKLVIKGSKRLHECLEAYYPEVAALDHSAPLFYAKKTGMPLQDKGVKKLLGAFVDHRGIEQCSPHSFRKFGAKHVFNSGYDVEIVSQILNHSSVRETRTYLDVKPREVEEAMGVLAF